MKIRQVFGVGDIAGARAAIVAARAAGVPDDGVSLIARADIEMEDIPSDRIDVSNDMIPAALRGAGIGGTMGVIGGLVAMAVPAVGITIAGVGLMAALGAAMGSWSSALMGTTVENPVRRRFEDEIAAGHILVVVDDDEARAEAVRSAIADVGAIPLPFEEATALST